MTATAESGCSRVVFDMRDRKLIINSHTHASPIEDVIVHLMHHIYDVSIQYMRDANGSTIAFVHKSKSPVDEIGLNFFNYGSIIIGKWFYLHDVLAFIQWVLEELDHV